MPYSRSFGSVQGVVDFHWTALTMGILPDESLDAFFFFLAIFGLKLAETIQGWAIQTK
jgi:hypothetical protein